MHLNRNWLITVSTLAVALGQCTPGQCHTQSTNGTTNSGIFASIEADLPSFAEGGSFRAIVGAEYTFNAEHRASLSAGSLDEVKATVINARIFYRGNLAGDPSTIDLFVSPSNLYAYGETGTAATILEQNALTGSLNASTSLNFDGLGLSVGDPHDVIWDEFVACGP